MGRVFMANIDCPFRKADEELERLRAETSIVVVDMHGEATSESQAMGWYLDGRVSAVVGTHSHVQTADERVLPRGTAYITDLGMTGPTDSVIGVDRSWRSSGFLTGMPNRFEPAKGRAGLQGAVIRIDPETGRALAIERPARPRFLTGLRPVALILDGKAVAAKVLAAVAEGVGAVRARGVQPTLAVVLVGEDPASKVYVGGKRRACQALGIAARDHLYPRGLAEPELLALVRELNADPSIHGILVQLPLPQGIDEDRVIAAVAPGRTSTASIPRTSAASWPERRACSRAPRPGSSRSSTTTAST